MVAAVLGAAVEHVPTWWQILSPLLAALIGVAAAVYTARNSYRASEQTNRVAVARLDHDRDSVIDARTDKQLAEAWAQLQVTRTELERRNQEFWALVERHQRLRLAVLALGHDPDAITGAAGGLLPGGS